MAEAAAKWLARASAAGFALVLVAVLAQHPLATNDGPVHVAFSDLIADRIANLITPGGEPDRELQRQAYEVDLRLTTNVLTYAVMAPLIALSSPAVAESIVQALCLLGPAAAGWLALRTIDRRNAWLALFLLPLSLHQMFFLGLYNFCLSTVGFFAVLASTFWLMQSPSYRRAVVLGAALTLTSISHAGGFIAAVTGLAAMTAARIVSGSWRGEAWRAVLMRERHALLALLLPLPFVLATLSASAGTEVDFGPGVFYRVANTLALRLLQLGAKNDVWLGVALSAVLLAALAWSARQIWQTRASMPVQRLQAFGAAGAALAASCVTVLVFPDTLGGGWTHIRRFMIFPFYWVLVLLAFARYTPRVKLALVVSAGLAAALSLATTLTRESVIQAQLQPWAQVDRLVGAHCTVLPLILESRPVDARGQPIAMSHDPYFQIASLLETGKDRVVLFNFLARLNVYPVRFKPNVEPQQHLFHWAPRQHEVDVETVDVESFEKSSGLHVDYWVLLGDSSQRSAALRKQIDAMAASSTLVYRSPDGRLRLYNRSAAGPCLAPADQAAG